MTAKPNPLDIEISPTELDESVQETLVTYNNYCGKSASVIEFDEVESWPEPINPEALLTEISATIQRFIACSKETADAATLWTAMTWLIDVIQVCPLAIITAPEKRCGKTQLLTVIGRLSKHPLIASNISPAAVFRVVDAWQPTLLIDEVDTFLRDNEELRGIINSGHTRDTAYVVRTVGKNFEPKRFSTWGAKALSGIGHMPETLQDRAIMLELRRKLPNEKVSRLRHSHPVLFIELSQKLSRFAVDYSNQIKQAQPDLPEKLNDRAQDNWEPLLAIADVAGGVWVNRARTAAMKISGKADDLTTTTCELLNDIQQVFSTKAVLRLSTHHLIEALCADDEAPWATYNKGKQITPRQLGKILGEYSIKSNTIRIGNATPKGFELEQFHDAFARYLPQNPEKSATPPQASIYADYSVADKVNQQSKIHQCETPEPTPLLGCGVVADKTSNSGFAV